MDRFHYALLGIVRLCLAGGIAYGLTVGSLVNLPKWQAAICWIAAAFLLLSGVARLRAPIQRGEKPPV